MGWRWLVQGLAGLVGMMINTLNDEQQLPIEVEHHDKLCELIDQLKTIRDQLTARRRTP